MCVVTIYINDPGLPLQLRRRLLEIELWGRLVSLISQVPSDYSNLYRQLDTTSSNLFIPHYRTGNSPADSQGIGHLYSKLSFMRRAEL
jgi:hypothetical protein